MLINSYSSAAHAHLENGSNEQVLKRKILQIEHSQKTCNICINFIRPPKKMIVLYMSSSLSFKKRAQIAAHSQLQYVGDIFVNYIIR